MKKMGCYIGLVVVMALHLLFLAPELSGREESVEWTVSALCLPHAEVAAPQMIQIRVAFSSTREGPTLSAFMNVQGTPSFSNTTSSAYWGVPQRKWVSFLFEGPPISNRYFCQTEWGDKQLHFRYAPASNLKIFFSLSGVPSGTELDAQESARNSLLILHAQGDSTLYGAGTGTSNPYWLQFAIPIYDVQSATTTLFSDFL